MAKLLRLSLATLTFPCFLLLDDLANAFFLSAGLGANRILVPLGRSSNAGCGQLEQLQIEKHQSKSSYCLPKAGSVFGLFFKLRFYMDLL